MSVAEKAAQLRALVRMISDSAEAVIQEWEAEGRTPHDVTSVPRLPSRELFEARRLFIGACGMGVDLVHDPFTRMTELATSFFNSVSLRIAADTRIADVLRDADREKGISIQEISRQVRIAPEDLCTCKFADRDRPPDVIDFIARVLRTLTSLHIFKEVKDDFYANTDTSRLLVDNEPLRCWLLSQ